jgi:aromatic amino acid aminotransferase I
MGKIGRDDGPDPMNLPLSKFGSKCGLNQTMQLIAPFFGIPDVAMLAQGAPPSSIYPIKAMSLELANGSVVRVDAPGIDDAQSYQYARSGYVPLTRWCAAFFLKHHRPPRETTAVALSAGTTEAIATLTELLVDPGEVCLTEEFTWSTALDGMRSRGIVLAGVRIDEHGLDPESLERECVRLREEGLTPRALYIVPNGSNPGGCVLATERFVRIYEICRAHRVCIIEDDPYWWLALGEGAPLPGPATSFASIDTDGIVVRLDSFAKVWRARPIPRAHRARELASRACVRARGAETAPAPAGLLAPRAVDRARRTAGSQALHTSCTRSTGRAR